MASEKSMAREAVPGKVGMRDLFSISLITELLETRVKNPQRMEVEKINVLVALPDCGQQRISYSLNLLGETCLRIYLVTKQIIANAQAGEVIEVVTCQH